MARLNTEFDPTQHNTEQREFENLPGGDYRLEVIESSVVPTKAGNGHILKATYSVLEPVEYRERKIFANINIENANAKAQTIGQEELSSLCRAMGLAHKIVDTEELHFHAFTGKVGLEKKQEGYAQRNKIVKFYFPDEGELPTPRVTEPGAPPANDNRAPPANDNRPAAATPAVAGARPWGKK